MNGWLILAVIFYPITLIAQFSWLASVVHMRLERFSALASGFIVFLVLWLYALPRDLAWDFGPIFWHSRFVLPLTAYLCGLVVAAVLMALTARKPAR